MASFPHPMGLLPSEVAFLCEMELVTIIPRQRLERLDLLGGPTHPLNPPTRTQLPLWLALLLKRQRRANIMPPDFLDQVSLKEILELETVHFMEGFSPEPAVPAKKGRDADGRGFVRTNPFLGSCTASGEGGGGVALPYHWFEISTLLLDAAADDIPSADVVRQLLRDIREVRLSKMRKGIDVLAGDGEGVRLDGVGAMEVSESRGLVSGVVDGLRQIGTSREVARREREEEEREQGRGGAEEEEDEDEDEDMS